MADNKRPTNEHNSANDFEVVQLSTNERTGRPRKQDPENGLNIEPVKQPTQRPRRQTEGVTERPRRQTEGTASPERPRRQTEGATERPRRQTETTASPERPRRQTEGVTERPRRQTEGTTERPRRQLTEEEIAALRERRARRQQAEYEVGNYRGRASQSEEAPVARRRRIAEDSTEQKREQQREQASEEKQRQHNMRRKEIEDAAKLFTKRTEPKNYFINLLLVTFKMFLVCILIIGISGVGFLLGMSKSYLEAVPQLDFDVVAEQDQATVLMDVKGEFLVNYYNMENREWATLEEIPDYLENAVIAIEDVRFRRHMGIDFKRLLSVVVSNLTSGGMQGGSTITQQLIKNTMLSFDQTYKRKIQEASLAMELERQYDKDDILEAYLNTIYMGGSCYGVKTAAMDYFGKELDQLTLRECACLAGMIQNPSKFNPRSNFYSRNNPARTNNRTNLVLYEMRDNGLINEEEYQAARGDALTVRETSPYSTKTGMIYFTDYVIDSVVSQIIEDRNLEDNSKNRTDIRKEIRTSGYNIYTTMEADKQKGAEEAVYNFNAYPNMRYSADSYTVIGRNPDGSVIRLIQPQAAIAVVDYHNGYIVALVGGRQAPTGSMQFNRAYQSTMPVGSAIKPIAVYAPAIEKGAGVGTVFYDYQMKINGWDSVNGYPANNSRSYSGRVTMRTAFVNSLNTSAAQALMYDVGLDYSFNTLVQLGVDPDHISKTGSGLALGSSGITPLEMAGAFSAIANMGVYIEPIAFTKVVDKDGNVIVDMLAQQESHRVFSESTAWQVTDMMRSVATSSISSRLQVKGQTVYGKTGTNSEMRGVFFAGFTGYYTGCAWVGSDAYKPLQDDAQGSRYAAPLFTAVMNAIHTGLPNKPANNITPEDIGVTQVEYCSISGKLATEACTVKHTEYGCPGAMEYCDMHKVVEICADSGALATENCPTYKRQQQTIVLTPNAGLMNYMYYNANERFVAIAGTPVINMSSCKLDHSNDTQETPENNE